MKKQLYPYLLPLLLIMLLMQACGQDNQSAENTTGANETTTPAQGDTTQAAETYAAPTRLEQKKWALETFTFQGMEVRLQEGTESFISFSKGKVSVIGTCNRFMGHYQEAGDELIIEQMAGTKKACPETMGQDSKLIRMLEDALQFEVSNNGDYLVMKGNNGSVTYTAVN